MIFEGRVVVFSCEVAQKKSTINNSLSPCELYSLIVLSSKPLSLPLGKKCENALVLKYSFKKGDRESEGKL